jgi:hypothetical protein
MGATDLHGSVAQSMQAAQFVARLFISKSAVWYPSRMINHVCADHEAAAVYEAHAMFFIAAGARFTWAGSLFYA